MARALTMIFTLLSVLTLLQVGHGFQPGGSSGKQARSKGEDPFFPFAVWYGGGKARAPMLEPDPEKSLLAPDYWTLHSLPPAHSCNLSSNRTQRPSFPCIPHVTRRILG